MGEHGETAVYFLGKGERRELEEASVGLGEGDRDCGWGAADAKQVGSPIVVEVADRVRGSRGNEERRIEAGRGGWRCVLSFRIGAVEKLAEVGTGVVIGIFDGVGGIKRVENGGVSKFVDVIDAVSVEFNDAPSDVSSSSVMPVREKSF